MIPRRRGAEQTAVTYIALFISRRRRVAFPPDSETVAGELSGIRVRRRDLLEKRKALESELRELKRDLMDVEAERSGIHFRSYTMFNENTALAIRLSALRSPHPGTAGIDVDGVEYDRILDRYVFRTDRSSGTAVSLSK